MANQKEYDLLFRLSAQLGGNYGSTFKSAQSAIASMQKEIDGLSKTQSDIASYQKQQGAISSSEEKLKRLNSEYAALQKQLTATKEYGTSLTSEMQQLKNTTGADETENAKLTARYQELETELKKTGVESANLQNKMLSKQQQIDKTSSSLDQQTQKLGQMGKALGEAGVDTGNLTKESARLGTEIDEVKQKQEEAADKAQNFGSAASQAFGAVQQAIVAAGITVALKKIYDAFNDCVDASIDFESAMTGVSKTTDMSDEELASMSETVKDLSTDIPITTDELAAVAETAGQLGIAKGDLIDFSEVMSMLSTATTMTADDAATMLAQFANITQMDPAYYSNLASAIVDLGNNYATTEQKITEMSQGIAASASLAGMSEADMVALSAAVTSLGIETQAGSTSMSKLISELMTAVETGENLNEIAGISNMTAGEFKTAWGENAVSALQAFVTGLSDTERNGKSATVALDDLGITEAREQRMILSLSNSGDLLTRTVNTANTAWSENTALTAEAEKRYGTTASKVTMMQNAYNNLKISVGDALTPALSELYAVATELLKGVTSFIEKNPALVKAVTAFVLVFAAVIAALTTYAVVAKVAAAASALLSAAIPGVNVIMAVTAAVAGITAGIVALVSAANEGVPSVKDLTEAARGMSDTMDEATATYEETTSATLAAANVADTYIDKLEEMEAAGIDTDEEHKQYHNTLALLCQVVPDLADSIDLETDTINGGTEALRVNTEAWKRNAMQQAYQDQLTKLYESYSSVLIEAEENSINLTKAQDAQKIASQGMTDTYSALLKALGMTDEQFRNTYWTVQDIPYRAVSDDVADLRSQYIQYSEDLQTAQKEEKAYKEATEDDSEATSEAEEQISLAEEAVKNLTDATEDGTDAATDAAAGEDELNDAIGGVTAQITTLTEAYNNAYDAALESIQGQYDLWDEAADVVATSAGTINSNLESQITYWQQYNDNLAKLTDRSADIQGLSDMIASFADGSSDSVNAIAGMASASDGDLAAMVTNWQELQTEQKNASSSVADLKTDFTATMDELQKELAADIDAMDLGTEAAESGKSTIQGFVNGAEGMIPSVQAAYARVAQSAIDAIDKKLDIHSPSRVMMEKANMTWAGYIKETEAMEPDVQEAMAGTAGAGADAISEEEAQIVALAPQLIAALGAYSNVTAASSETAGAISATPGASPASIQVVFQIDGNATPEVLSELQRYGDDFADKVRQVMEDAGIEAARRGYR